MRVLKLIYPERRVISEREVIAWARDLLCDKEIENLHERLGKPPEDYVVDRVYADMRIPTLQESIALLTDQGVATFERGRDAAS